MGNSRGRSFAAALAACVALCAGSEVSPAELQTPGGASAETGSVCGSVTLGRQLATHRMKFSLYADAQSAEVRRDPPSMADEVRNVVVYLERVPEGATSPTAPRGPFRMEQIGLSFEPHVLTVVKGTTVEFPNRDMLFHNVFSLSRPATFDLGRFPQNASKSLQFDKPGIVKVFCHIHSDMSGVIVVLENSFFASPGPDGRFVIEGIPPGDYRVVAWHERARMSAKRVHVDAGKASVLDFEIPLSEDEHAD
jgi:plastocyanin